MKDFCGITDDDFQCALYDDVHFLIVMRNEVIGRIQSLFGIRNYNAERLADTEPMPAWEQP